MMNRQEPEPKNLYARLATEITRGVSSPLAAHPLARPLWEVTGGCRQCSQGTIGGSRLQGLGGHSVGEDRLGITGAKSPPDLIVAPPRIEATHEKREELWEGGEGQA